MQKFALAVICALLGVSSVAIADTKIIDFVGLPDETHISPYHHGGAVFSTNPGQYFTTDSLNLIASGDGVTYIWPALIVTSSPLAAGLPLSLPSIVISELTIFGSNPTSPDYTVTFFDTNGDAVDTFTGNQTGKYASFGAYAMFVPGDPSSQFLHEVQIQTAAVVPEPKQGFILFGVCALMFTAFRRRN